MKRLGSAWCNEDVAFANRQNPPGPQWHILAAGFASSHIHDILFFRVVCWTVNLTALSLSKPLRRNAVQHEIVKAPVLDI